MQERLGVGNYEKREDVAADVMKGGRDTATNGTGEGMVNDAAAEPLPTEKGASEGVNGAAAEPLRTVAERVNDGRRTQAGEEMGKEERKMMFQVAMPGDDAAHFSGKWKRNLGMEEKQAAFEEMKSFLFSY